MDQKTQEILDQAKRRQAEQRKAEADHQAALDNEMQLNQAWDQAIRACESPIPDDAEQRIRTLAALLKKRGWDAWIPSMRELADEGRYLFLGWLQHACSGAPEGAIQESMQATIPGMEHGKVRGDADDVKQCFSNRAGRNGQPPPVPPPEPKAQRTEPQQPPESPRRKRHRSTKDEVGIKTLAAMAHKAKNPTATEEQCAEAANMPRTTLAQQADWMEWGPKVERASATGNLPNLKAEVDKRIGEFVAIAPE